MQTMGMPAIRMRTCWHADRWRADRPNVMLVTNNTVSYAHLCGCGGDRVVAARAFTWADAVMVNVDGCEHK